MPPHPAEDTPLHATHAPALQATTRDVGPLPLATAFFLSGFAALVYQVVWQRMLFIAFGVDIESVTIVVSTFMFGLGIGAWAGGRLADALQARIPLGFCAMEALIGLIGLASIDVIGATGIATAGLSRGGIAVVSFLLLLPPTLLMGATLPMLVAYAWRRTRSVGVSTGSLYFINTLGAAIGAAASGFLLLHWFDAREATWIAAAANLLAAGVIGAAVAWRRS